MNYNADQLFKSSDAFNMLLFIPRDNFQVGIQTSYYIFKNNNNIKKVVIVF